MWRPCESVFINVFTFTVTVVTKPKTANIWIDSNIDIFKVFSIRIKILSCENMRRCFRRWLVLVCNQYSWQLVEFASNQTRSCSVKTWIHVLQFWCSHVFPSKKYKAGRDKNIKVLMVSVRFNLFVLPNRKIYTFLKLSPFLSRAVFFAELHTSSFIVALRTLRWNISVKD